MTQAVHTGGALQWMVSKSSGFNVVYKTLAVVVLAGLLHKVIFRRKTYKLFPAWAAIEIALTSYLLGRGGLGGCIW
jgi:hypothetical protein